MDYLGLSFGKKHRAHKRHGKVAKPPAKLLRICKKYRVKATKKVGGKRVYKKVSVLKKLCLRKARALKKKLMKAHKKSIKHHKRRAHPKRRSHHRRGDAFGDDSEMMMEFGRRHRRSAFGADNMTAQKGLMDKGMTLEDVKAYYTTGENTSNFARKCIDGKKTPQISCVAKEMKFGRRRRRSAFGEIDAKTQKILDSQGMTNDKIKLFVPMGKAIDEFRKSCESFNMRPQAVCISEQMKFGKKRHAKVSKKAAMKAFRSFYKRHCAGRRSGFGNGGNPPLNQSMGYEFCPDGRGGVLGFNSTGLFPSPCTPYSSSAPTMAALPPPTKVSEGGFGRRRNVKRRNVKRRTTTIGARKRRSTTIGARKRRSTTIGARKRRV